MSPMPPRCLPFERKAETSSHGRDSKNDQFRGAMAECMTCWFLAGRMRLTLDTWAPGRENRMLEMKIVSDTGDIGVEVKVPFEELTDSPPEHSSYHYAGESHKLAPCMVAANKQFSDMTPNILVIAPRLERSIVQTRNELIRAAYGESKITSFLI